ncbi:MAG: hypothetical protein ACLU0O_07400 [Collinsella sp.]
MNAPPCRLVDFTSPVLYPHLFGLCAYELLMSHGSAGLEPTAEDKLLKTPVAPGYSFAFSTPRSQWQAGTMPHMYQIDPAWSELPYAGGTIRQNACGPTCLTMVYIFKTGHTDMTPVDMCALSEAGNYAPTGATEWSFMTSGAWQLDLTERNSISIAAPSPRRARARPSSPPFGRAPLPALDTTLCFTVLTTPIRLSLRSQLGQLQRPPLGRRRGPNESKPCGPTTSHWDRLK